MTDLCKCIGQPLLFWISSYMSLWSNILFNCVVVINMIVAFFYPFDNTVPGETIGKISKPFKSNFYHMLQSSVPISPCCSGS